MKIARCGIGGSLSDPSGPHRNLPPMSRAQIAAFFAVVPVLYWPALCLELVKLKLWAQRVDEDGWRYVRVSVDAYGRLHAEVVPTREDEWERCDWPPTLDEALARSETVIPDAQRPGIRSPTAKARHAAGSRRALQAAGMTPLRLSICETARAPPATLDKSRPSVSVAARFMRAAHL